MAKNTTESGSKAQAVRDYMKSHPKAGPKAVANALTAGGIAVAPRYVSNVKAKKKKTKPRKSGDDEKRKYTERPYPQKTLEDALRIPRLIKEKNGGKPWATADLADALGYTNLRTPAFLQLTRSARDFGLTLGTHTTEEIELTDLGRDIVYPDDEQKERELKTKAFFRVDVFKKVYEHYGGSSSFPEKKYVSSILEKNFGLTPELHDEFIKIFKANCRFLGIEDGTGKVDTSTDHVTDESGDVRVVGKAEGKFDRTAFVIMPFSEKEPIERPKGFFSELLETVITPAANDAGFAVKTAEQKGSDVIQSTIINQLLKADLVIADLTDHNPNVLFELGIRIAKELPVALISAEGTDRVFDVDNMMRVVPYSPNLWPSTVERDLARLSEHIKAAWDNRTTYRSYMEILTGQVTSA